MAENIKKPQQVESNNEINSTNIFDEFGSDNLSLMEEVEKLKEEAQKDIYYYLNIAWKILGYIFWLFLLVFLVLLWYIYIQKSDSFYDQAFLDPVCGFMLWETPNPDAYLWCSSISSTNKYYIEKLWELKKDQSIKVFPLISLVYEQENFLKSKEITFLLNKSENKFRVLDVISRFDKLKNDYVWIYNKDRILCSDILLDSDDNTFSVKCEAYSSDFDNKILGLSWNRDDLLWGTSISIANSFLNYIERTSKDFTIIDKQRVFKSSNITWEKGYTNKTPFDITLKINF